MVQIEARLNGHHVCTAGLTSKGYLSAHLNLARDACLNQEELGVTV